MLTVINLHSFHSLNKLLKLLLFVNACKDDMDRSAKWLHVYYKMKKNAPEFFANRDVFSKEMQFALDHQVYLTLPVTPDNCTPILHKLSDYNPKTYVFDETIKTFIMTAGKFFVFKSTLNQFDQNSFKPTEAITFKHGPRDGTIFLFDFEGGTFWHLFRPTISSIRKGIEFLQGGSPLNVTSIHVFNVPYFMDIIFCEFLFFLSSNFSINFF